MRLHVTICVASLALAGLAAAAEPPVVHAEKQLEGAPGSAHARPAKLRPSTQAQLFVESKDAPQMSKTALRLESVSRISAKSKD